MKQTDTNLYMDEYLECERWWVYGLLMFVGAFFGGFTYSVRGGVFANAQTANFVLMALSAANGNIRKSIYYFIPMSSYLCGIIISEIVPVYIKNLNLFVGIPYLYL